MSIIMMSFLMGLNKLLTLMHFSSRVSKGPTGMLSLIIVFGMNLLYTRHDTLLNVGYHINHLGPKNDNACINN